MKPMALALAFAVLVLPASGRAADFCAQMKGLADGAPAGFSALRGADAAASADGSWRVAQAPGGATSCSVFPKSADQGAWMTCDIDGYAKWKTALTACFPAVPAATAKDQMGVSTTFTFERATLAVDDSNGLTVQAR